MLVVVMMIVMVLKIMAVIATIFPSSICINSTLNPLQIRASNANYIIQVNFFKLCLLQMSHMINVPYALH
uniref:Uncharacterized protein n=1 Tax=Rhizophora mucronata TaxID=61149 RepID=A0A2P2MU73_RHIMU